MKRLFTTAIAVLAAAASMAEDYYHSAASSPLKPVPLTGNAQEDWQKFALEAEVCVADEMPAENMLASWRRLGVKMLRRAAWSEEGSAEFFRRQTGFLPFHEHADGVWLEGEEHFPETWKRALAEAKTDLEVAQYLDALADEAIASGDHRLKLEGRRVKWMFDEFDFASMDLDRLRLEFVAYAKFLEDVLGKPAKNLPADVPAPITPDGTPFTPGAPLKAETVTLAYGVSSPLAGGMTFRYDGQGFEFRMPDTVGHLSLRLYIPGEGPGTWVPYEYVIDLSDEDDSPRAPVVGRGLFTLADRFGGRGGLGDRRCRAVRRRSPSPSAPDLHASFHCHDENTKNCAVLGVEWMNLYGKWPSVRNGVTDRWYVVIAPVPGSDAAAAFQLVWPRGKAQNFNAFAHGVNEWKMGQRYAAAVGRAKGLFTRSAVEERYGPVKAKKPTFQLFDLAGDQMFAERCVLPKVEANADLARITHAANICEEPAYKNGEPHLRDRVWHALDRLLYFDHETDIMRRDYLALRLAGKEPPEPGPKDAPDVRQTTPADPDALLGDDMIELDDKEF